MKKIISVVCLFVCVTAFAEPVVNDLKITSIPPWGIAIDYNVSEAEFGYKLQVSAMVNDKTYAAKALVGETNCVNGSCRVYWNMAKDGITLDVNDASVTVTYEKPLYCVIDLTEGDVDDAKYAVSYFVAEPDGGFNTPEYKTTKLVLRRVDAGSFKMQGATTVTLTRPFYMGLFEVTQKQWSQVMGTNPCSSTAYGLGDEFPVHYVSYDMIRGTLNGADWPTSNAVDGEGVGDEGDSFLGRLRRRTGLTFDLPTEAQWEYACRAGTTKTYSYGDNANGDYMWYSGNSTSSTHVVGTKLTNKWGFYDMHGNVWEWCRDWYGDLEYGTDPRGVSTGSGRVRRGGSWYAHFDFCSSSSRVAATPSEGYCYGGFRLSRTLP